jgi:hypothetical protein
MSQSEDLIIIYSGNAIETGLIKSLFEGEGIQTFLQDSIMGVMAPWRVTPGGQKPIKILIKSKDYKRAQFIIDNFYKTNNSNKQKELF